MTPLQALASGALVLACLLGVPALLALAGLAIIRHRTPTQPTPEVEQSCYSTHFAQWETELDPQNPSNHVYDHRTEGL